MVLSLDYCLVSAGEINLSMVIGSLSRVSCEMNLSLIPSLDHCLVPVGEMNFSIISSLDQCMVSVDKMNLSMIRS